MWTYSQSTGELKHDGALIGIGSAGNGAGLNNPDLQHVPGVGPLPRGMYFMREVGKELGFWLKPYRTNSPDNRQGTFWIHAETGSEGCIEMPLIVRQRIKEILTATEDRTVEVRL